MRRTRPCLAATVVLAFGASGCFEGIDPANANDEIESSSGSAVEDSSPPPDSTTTSADSGDSPQAETETSDPDPTTTGSDTNDDSDESDPPPCGDLPGDPGAAPLSRLTPLQYRNTIEATFGAIPGLTDVLPPEIPSPTLGAAQAAVNSAEVESYGRAAEHVAAYVTSDPGRLATAAPCPDGEDASRCAEAFLHGAGAALYRGPLTDPGDLERHLALFEAGAREGYAHGIELLLTGILQSPRFLYRVEIGTSDHVSDHAVRLTSRELANRLSYAIWNGPPDGRLLEVAESGGLETKDGVLDTVDWMLQDPRGARYVQSFLERWIHLDRVDEIYKREDLYPEWGAIRGPIQRQASAFFDAVMTTEGGSLNALLTSPTVLANEELAPLYASAGGSEFVPTDADVPTSGLLTLPAVLAVLAKAGESSPIYRGVFVRESLLCQHPPAPPADIPPAPEVDSGGSTRDRLAQHVSDPTCAACHRLLDPIGLGFEHFDAIGRYRESDGGKPVDASGELTQTDVDGAFDGVVELGEKLAQSAIVETCLTRQWFRFSLGRAEEKADQCSMDDLQAAFAASGQDLRALPSALFQTDAFLYRRPSDAEVTP